MNKKVALKNLVSVIIKPRIALTNASQSPKILSYLIPILLVQLAIFFLDLTAVLEYSNSLIMSKMENISEDIILTIKSTTKMVYFFSTLLNPVVVIFVLTLLIYLLLMLLTYQVEFKKLFCLNIISYIPVTLGNVIKAILIRSVPVENIPTVTTSLALFLDTSTSIIYKLCSHIDIFFTWSLILMSISAAIVCDIKSKKILFIFFGIYIVIIIIQTIL